MTPPESKDYPNSTHTVRPGVSRRSFVKGTLLASAGLGIRLEGSANDGAVPSLSAPSDSGSAMPRGRIGKLEVSRLILGGNLLTHFTHSRDLKYVYNLAAHYNTDEKILETLAVAERNGVNTLTIHDPPEAFKLLKRYRHERGGKIQWILCTTAPVEPDLLKYRERVETLVQEGCEAIYLWGVHADSLAAQGKTELMAKAVDFARSLGVPSGVGAHSLEVIRACETNGVKADFYIKTFHHHSYRTGPKPDQLKEPYNEFPGYWCSNPEETATFMKNVQKPWIAFKTMAAGAIQPSSAFRYAFLHGADFILAGMFDFEIAEDAKVVAECFARTQNRERPWPRELQTASAKTADKIR